MAFLLCRGLLNEVAYQCGEIRSVLADIPASFSHWTDALWRLRREANAYFRTKRLTENELSDFSRLWHDGCGVAIIEAQDVDRNHSAEV